MLKCALEALNTCASDKEFDLKYWIKIKKTVAPVTDPDAADRLEARREYNRQYLLEYNAKKRAAEKEAQNVSA